MRRPFVVVMLSGVVIAAMAPSAGAQEPDDPDAEAEQVLSVGGQVAPKAVSVDKAPTGPNPYLALVPDPAVLDYSGWARYVERRGEVRADQRRIVASPILVDEDEPAGTAAPTTVPNGRARPGLRDRAGTQNHRRGSSAPCRRRSWSPRPVAANAEDDGSIPLAGETGHRDSSATGSARRP